MNGRARTEDEALRLMAGEIGRLLPWNQAECWARILWGVAQAAPPNLAAKCGRIAEAVRRSMPLPPEPDRLARPVSPREAQSMGMTGHRLSAISVMTLHCLLYEIEQALGADHHAVRPIHWYRSGVRRRAWRILTREDVWSHN